MTQTIQLKRTLTPNNPPGSLALGELSLGLGDVPIRMYAGTPTGVRQLFAGQAIEDAPSDAVYGRSNGEWVQVPIIAPVAPVNPPPGALWCNSSTMLFYIFFNDQWVGIR